LARWLFRAPPWLLQLARPRIRSACGQGANLRRFYLSVGGAWTGRPGAVDGNHCGRQGAHHHGAQELSRESRRSVRGRLARQAQDGPAMRGTIWYLRLALWRKDRQHGPFLDRLASSSRRSELRDGWSDGHQRSSVPVESRLDLAWKRIGAVNATTDY